MKKLLVVLSLTFLLNLSFAQDQQFKKFRVGLAVGYAKASGDGAKGGVLINFEPGYRIMDNVLINLRYESALVARGTATATDFDAEVAAIGSYSFNGQYYFNNNGFRPYAGLGVGFFSLAAVRFSDTDADAAAAVSKLGFYPRIGFDAGHFNVNIDYNLIPATKGIGGTEFKNSYMGIRIGAFIGGGRK